MMMKYTSVYRQIKRLCYPHQRLNNTRIWFVPFLLVEFHKRLKADILGEIDDYGIPGGGRNCDDMEVDAEKNIGTLILDANCASQNLIFPQNVNHLDEARENLEGSIDDYSRRFDYHIPQMYRINARIDKKI